MEQISESNIDACSCCGEFHSVAWYNVENEQDILLYDSMFAGNLLPKSLKYSLDFDDTYVIIRLSTTSRRTYEHFLSIRVPRRIRTVSM